MEAFFTEFQNKSYDTFKQYFKEFTASSDQELGQFQSMLSDMTNFFIQINFTGPPPKQMDSLREFEYKKETMTDLDWIVCEEIYEKVDFISFLYFSILGNERLLELKNDSSSHYKISQLYYLLQKVTLNPSEKLQNILQQHIEQFNSESMEEMFLKVLITHQYHQDKQVKLLLNDLQQKVGLEWEMTGKLGKRTKFQQNDLAQLTLEVKNFSKSASNTSGIVPKEVPLSSDTLHETIQFKDATDEPVKISPIEQCLLLLFSINIKSSNPSDEITTEQLFPFLRTILAHPQNFMIHTVALLQKSRLESQKPKTVERALFQLQALVEQYHLEDETSGCAPFEERLQWFWYLDLQTQWELQKELADRFMSLGALKSGLQIYEQLELWEQIIQCHILLDDTKETESILNEQLKLHPERPLFWCLLGDLKQDPALYEKAWEVSNQRFARAMRSLGHFYYKKGEFQQAITSFQKSLQLNALFGDTWFTLGCACMHITDYDLALNAFMKCVHLNTENGEAWNNLCAIYIKLEKLEDAYKCLREAVKEKYENWKIWENYLGLSLTLGRLDDAILAGERLLALKWVERGSLDLDALKELYCLVENSNSTGSRQRAESLLEKICQQHSTSSDLWLLCAHYYRNDNEKRIQAYQSAYRLLTANDQFTTDRNAFHKLSKVIKSLIDCYGDRSDGIYQSKLILRKVLKMCKDEMSEDPVYVELEEIYQQMQEQVGK